MNDINFKDIRVLPGQLELKGNNAKTFADLVQQLQSGSILKGLVVGTTAKSEVIFHTAIGRFISPNPLGLTRGDTITIRLANEGEDVLGTIVKVNHEDPKIIKPINIAFVRDTESPKIQTNIQAPRDASVTKFSGSGLDTLPSTIKGNISYFNLTKIDSGSLLYKTLLNNFNVDSNQNTIEFKLLPKSDMLGGQLQIMAEVASEAGKESGQMIRTPFGIISVDNLNLQKGQSLFLEISKINNYEVANSTKNQLTEFVMKLNSSMAILQKLNVAEVFSSKAQNMQISSDDLIKQNSSTSTLNKEFIGNIKLPDLTGTISNAKSPPTSIELGERTTSEIIKNNATANIQSDNVKISTQISQSTDNNTLTLKPADHIIINAKGIGENTKLIEELSKLGLLVSNLRISTRKLRQNQQQFDAKNIQNNVEDVGAQSTDGKPIKTDRHQVRGMNSALKNLSDLEAIKKLSSEFVSLKEVFLNNPPQKSAPDLWVNILIPFPSAKEVYEQEVRINYPADKTMRFLINLDLQAIGQIQLDGLVKYGNKINTPTSFAPASFDLVVRSKERFATEIQSSINKIYAANQDITGIRGRLFFDESEEFI